MLISLIVAAAQNGVIGRDNQLIWHLPDDLKQFKRLTTGHPIIMGRKTFNSIGKPLPNRTSIVITRNQDWQFEGVIVVNSVNEAVEAARQTGTDEAFVIGGAEVYKMTLPVADKIYLTEVKAEFEGDAYFTIPNKEEWQEVSRVSHATDEKHTIAFDFVELVRQG
ncbi:dihydrofolate reductase [Runella salmonicolor]|uniref:Dihydrofolate reductase n=1 Tax=Runella salmonicolor TaxID=2950278 RepID=A0ABT1FJ65_9BACT|nr:dihydrofolate reductase [Runella salmonicolor]MCP1381747.1 dihydrofolate reductase [Runella salmonicolor]